MPLTKGTEIGRYRIVEKIGAGGMGEVYLAEDTELNRRVALKFLPSSLCLEEECRTRFKREAQAAAKLNHPNIVTIFEVSEFDGRPFFAMEYIEGRSLKEKIEHEKLSLDEIIVLAEQFCEALKKAHDAHIVHRDIKPSNIMIDIDGRLKILDFGLAAVAGMDKITRTGSTLGTYGYMSPEQIQGKELDHRSDIFSFGTVIFEMITSVKLFQGDNEAAISHAIIYDTSPPLNKYNPEIPPGLQSIIDKMLEKTPEMRYASAVEILRDLKSLKNEIDSDASRQKVQSSIAVLPFTNLSADPEQEYFCDGMAEEIINALTHIEELRVVARTSCFAFKGQNADIREIGRKLNVDNILEGSVRKAGKRLRITAQLIKVSDGYHIWSEKYDRDMEDVFAIQDEISLAIVENLKIKLLRKEKAVLTERYKVDPEAYNLYLKGRYFWSKRLLEGYEKAIAYFEKAIEIDPNYAQAYAGIAECYNDMPHYSSFPPSRAYSLAKEAAIKALELNDKLAEAHAALGLIKSDHEWDWEGSERELKRAIELNPAYETAHHWYGLLLSYLGRFEESFQEMERALELDPLSMGVIRNLANIYYFARRYDDAIQMTNKVIEMNPGFPFAYLNLGLSYLSKFEFEKAIEALQKEKDFGGGVNPFVVPPLGAAYARMGDMTRAEEILASIEERMKHEYVSAFSVAQLYFALGKIDQGFEFLEKAYVERDIFLRMVKVMPVEDEVINDPRYTALLKKMKLD